MLSCLVSQTCQQQQSQSGSCEQQCQEENTITRNDMIVRRSANACIVRPARALTGSTQPKPPPKPVWRAIMLKTTARGQGQHQCFVRPIHTPNTSKLVMAFMQHLLHNNAQLSHVLPVCPVQQHRHLRRRSEPSVHLVQHENHSPVPIVQERPILGKNISPHHLTSLTIPLHARRSEPSVHVVYLSEIIRVLYTIINFESQILPLLGGL